MKIKPNDFKVYAEYAEEHDLKPAICSYPIMYFKDQDGNTIKKNINSIYKAMGWTLNPSNQKWSKTKRGKKGENI